MTHFFERVRFFLDRFFSFSQPILLPKTTSLVSDSSTPFGIPSDNLTARLNHVELTLATMETTIYPAFDVNSPTLVSFILEDNPEPKEDVKEIFQRFHLLRKKEMRCVLVRKTQSVDKFLEDFERRIAIRKARDCFFYAT